MIRGGAVKQMRHLREPLLWAALILAFALIAYSFRAAHWMAFAVPIVLMLMAVTGFVQAFIRMRLSSAGDAQGAVLVDERCVSYFGPNEGGFVYLDSLLRIEVRGEPDARYWVLYHKDDVPLKIPQHAPGADQLFDVFTSLSGLSLMRISAALSPQADEIELVWSKPEPPTSTSVH